MSEEEQRLSREEIKALVAESVRETLIQLGISSNDPLQMQKDMAHLRRWRECIESAKEKGFLMSTTIVFTGLFAALWAGFKQLLK